MGITTTLTSSPVAFLNASCIGAMSRSVIETYATTSLDFAPAQADPATTKHTNATTINRSICFPDIRLASFAIEVPRDAAAHCRLGLGKNGSG